MALPTEQILLGSPYYVSKETATLDVIVIDLWVYTGELTTDKPSDPVYRLEATAFPNGDGNKYAEIDIAEFARDYVSVTYDFSASDPTNAVWIEYDLYFANAGALALSLDSQVSLTGLNGYGYFEDGYNPTANDTVLQSTNYIVVPEGDNATIPILQDYVTEWKLYGGNIAPGNLLETVSASATVENTANVIDYVSSFSSFGTATNVRFSFTGRPDQDIAIVRVDDCEHGSIECAFVNRWGAIQHIFLYGRATRSMSTNQTTYKRNLLGQNGTYDIKKHQTATLNKNGKTRITIDTGWYPEESNGVWKELFLSEKVWLNLNSEFLDFDAFKDISITAPVIINTNTIQYKLRKYDKMISYVIDFEFAADRKNTVT